MSSWQENNIPVNVCPYCGYKFDRASGLHKHKPKPGDYMVCLSCSQVLLLTGKMTPRMLTVQEDRELPEDVRVYRRAVQMTDRSRT